MDDELNYDSSHASRLPKPSQTNIPKPKVFSLTQSMNQRENIVVTSSGHRSRLPFSENPKAFRPGRLLGGDQNTNRAPIFPALQLFQKPRNKEPPQRPQAATPFFSLLPPPTSGPASTPPNVFYSHSTPAYPIDSSPHLKQEPPSDKDVPLSPSPQPRTAHTAQLQMLPPCSPVLRARSRSNSSVSFRHDENTIADHSSDLPTPSKSKGRPDIAITVLRELQVVNDELVEERRHKQSVVNQLNALSSAHEAFTSNHSMCQQEIVSTQKELDATRNELRDLQSNFDGANDDNKKKQHELKEALQQLGSVRTELMVEREERKHKMVSVREHLAELGKNYAQLQTSFDSLKLSYDASQALLVEMRQARGWAADRIRSLEPLLDAGNNYACAGEIKVLIGEMQNELADSHRVNDLLRDKLHYQSSQLAETKDRVRDLEDAEKGRLSEIVAILHGTGSGADGETVEGGLAEKIRGVVERLVKHEHEAVEVRAEAAGAVARSEALTERLAEVKKMLAQREKEVEELMNVRDANRSLESRVRELEGIEESMQQTTNELKNTNNVLQGREKEIAILQSEVVGLRSGKAELQALLAEARANVKLAEDNAKKAEKSLVEESRKFGEAQGKCDFLEIELGEARRECEKAKKMGLRNDLLDAELQQVKKEAGEQENTFRQAENQVLLLQERLDAQGITLRLAKEHGRDLQERLLTSESSFAAKVASINGAHKTQLAVFQERSTNLQHMVDGLKQDAASMSVQVIKKMEKQEVASERLIKVETKRADAAEREAADTRRQIEEEQRMNGELRKQIGEFEAEWKHAEEVRRKIVMDAEAVKDEQLLVLKDMVRELESVNEELMKKANTLKERYEAKDLTDPEKDFVDWLLRVYQSLHEQEDVAKENELRRRDNMIGTLQGRINELEFTLARLLHEKAKEAGGLGRSKPMVDLTMWMSSPSGSDHVIMPSDISAATPRASHVLSLPVPASAAPAPSAVVESAILAAPVPASTVISVLDAIPDASPAPAPRTTNKPIPKPKAPKLASADGNTAKATTSRATQKRKATKTLTALAASDLDSDSEEDVPLSELSDLSPYVSGLGKRARPASKVEKPRVTRRLATKKTKTAPESSPPLEQTSEPVQKMMAEAPNVKPKQKRRKA